MLPRLKLLAVYHYGAPPIEPQAGLRLIIDTDPDAGGAFDGRPNHIAIYGASGWSFMAPQIGWRCYIEELAQLYIFDGAI